MNQVARTAPTAPLPNVAGSRASAAKRHGVASFDNGPVEQLGGKVGVSFNDAALAYENEGRGFSRQRDTAAQQNQTGLSAPSQVFAAIFEIDDAAGASAEQAAVAGSRGFAGLLAKAIHTYEANARVISGNNNTLGASVSLTL